MARKIWKYTVPVDDEDHEIPAKIIHCEAAEGRDDLIQVWCEVEVNGQPARTMKHRVFGTGQPIPPEYEHRGTVHTGPFYWHLYAYVPFGWVADL